MGARKVIRADTMDDPNCIFIECTCLEHAQHLVALSVLKAADRCLKGFREWTYYSSLATLVNVCRDVSKQLFRAWTEAYGAESAKKCVRTLFPKACSGRWSGCDRPEQRLLQCGKDMLAPILASVLKTKMSKSDDGDTKSKSHPSINDIAIEETKAYAEKMGRWRKRSLSTVQDTLFWRVMEVMHTSRKPLTHLHSFLQQRQLNQWNHVAQLATGKALSISEEFLDIWPRLTQFQCMVEGEDEEPEESQFIRNFAFFSCVTC